MTYLFSATLTNISCSYDMVPCKITKDFIKVVFHPANNETFVIINKQSVVYCEIKPIYDIAEEEQTKVVRYQVETKYLHFTKTPNLISFLIENIRNPRKIFQLNSLMLSMIPEKSFMLLTPCAEFTFYIWKTLRRNSLLSLNKRV